MSRAGLTVALYLSLTFVSGVALGGFGFWFYQSRTVRAESDNRPSPEELRVRYSHILEDRLHLTADQVTRLDSILDTTRALMGEVTAKHQPEYDAIQAHQTEQIRKMLTPEQLVEYEKFRQEREKSRRNRGKRGGRPPGPPPGH